MGKPELVIHSGERRSSARQTFRASAFSMLFGGLHLENIELLEFSFGRLAIHLPMGIVIPPQLLVEPTTLTVKQDEECIINGVWKLTKERPFKTGKLLCFELPHLEILENYQTRISPEVLLRSSRYKLYQLDHHPDASELNRHITDIKDFPISLPCRLIHAKGSITANFDFSSNEKSLSEFHFNTAQELPKGENVFLEYTLFAARYVMLVRVLDYDSDFSLLVTSLPHEVIAVTARRFDRFECDLPATLQNTTQKFQEKAIELSPLGATLTWSSGQRIVVGDSLQLNLHNLETRSLSCTVARIDANQVYVRFPSDPGAKETIRQLMAFALPKPLVRRSLTNYDAFLRLYQDVGYAPTNAEEFSKWKEESMKTWAIQDQSLIQNCTGVQGESQLISSIGTLPISPHVVYGHSLCMIKSAQSASCSFEQLVHSLSWVELLPAITHYGGSYAKTSKFTTRLQVIFEAHARPENQIIAHVLRIFPSNDEYPDEQNSFYLKFNHHLPVNSQASDQFKFLLHTLSKPHPICEPWHQVECHTLHENGRDSPIAIIFDHHAIPYFTAAGVFEYCWIFLLNENVNSAKVCNYLRNHGKFRKKTLQLVLKDGTQEPPPYVDGNDRTVPAFWTFTPKEDFGPIISSMARAVYAVLQKYGEAGALEMSKVL